MQPIGSYCTDLQPCSYTDYANKYLKEQTFLKSTYATIVENSGGKRIKQIHHTNLVTKFQSTLYNIPEERRSLINLLCLHSPWGWRTWPGPRWMRVSSCGKGHLGSFSWLWWGSGTEPGKSSPLKGHLSVHTLMQLQLMYIDLGIQERSSIIWVTFANFEKKSDVLICNWNLAEPKISVKQD